MNSGANLLARASEQEFQRAVEARRTGDVRRAAACLWVCHEEGGPELAEKARRELVLLLCSQHRRREAMDLALMCLAHGDSPGPALVLLGYSQLDAFDLEGAIASLRVARRMLPDGSRYRVCADSLLCRALALGGETEDARSIFRSLPRVSPWTEWIEAILLRAEGRHADSTDLLRQVANDPRTHDLGPRYSALLWTDLSLAALNLGKGTEAIRAAARAAWILRKIDSGDPEAARARDLLLVERVADLSLSRLSAARQGIIHAGRLQDRTHTHHLPRSCRPSR